MNPIESIQTISSFTRLIDSPYHSTTKTIKYIENNGKVTSEVIVSVYNKYGAIQEMKNSSVDVKA